MSRRPFASGRSLAPAKLSNPKLAAKQAEQLAAFWAPAAETKLSTEAEAAADALCAKWAALGLTGAPTQRRRT